MVLREIAWAKQEFTYNYAKKQLKKNNEYRL